MNEVSKNGRYEALVQQIAETFRAGRQRTAVAINTHLIETYWAIGQYIVEFEQAGSASATYGEQLLP